MNWPQCGKKPWARWRSRGSGDPRESPRSLFGKEGALTGVLKSLGKLPPRNGPRRGLRSMRLKRCRPPWGPTRLCRGRLWKRSWRRRPDNTLPGRQGSRGDAIHAVTMARIVESSARRAMPWPPAPKWSRTTTTLKRSTFPPTPAGPCTIPSTWRVEQATGDPRCQAPAHPHLPGAGAHHGEHPAADSIICPGKVYRVDSDVTHTYCTQVEGLVWGKASAWLT